MEESTIWWLLAGGLVVAELLTGTFYLLMLAVGVGAAGIAAGGGKPCILIQNTGLLESGDSMRGWGLGMNVPVVMIVGYRGYTRHGVNTDTVADFTEPFLIAFGIKYYLVERDSDADRIGVAFEESRKKMRPVAVLVGDEYHGFN